MSRAPVSRRIAAVVAAIAVGASVVAGCGSSGAGATLAPRSSASVPIASPVASSGVVPLDVTPIGVDRSPFPTGSAALAVAIDDALAAIFPATIDGLPVQRATATEQAALTSGSLGSAAAGFAAVDVGAPDMADLAVASIVRLKPTTDAGEFYKGWRSSFDEAACGPAGGVSSREVRTIDGREVDTTLCTEGAVVYHLRVDGDRIVVSVLEVGPKGFGAALLEGLQG